MIAICAMLFTLAADPTPKDSITPRKPNPLAPSLPELTDKEEAELDKIVDRFIQADTGKLKGAEAKSAIDEFKELGPESTFALIRGFNKSASIEHSCPALTIARKLNSFFRLTSDTELLQYAKENIGAGVKKTKFGDVIREMKLGISQRQAAIKNAPTNEIRNTPKP